MGDNSFGFDKNAVNPPSSAQYIQHACYVHDTNGTEVSIAGWANWDADNSQEVWVNMRVIESNDASYVIGDTVTSLPDYEQVSCVATATPQVQTIQCYNREEPVSEPHEQPNNVANKGYFKQRYFQTAQFESEGNTGTVDSGFHSIVVTDEDGLPTVNGDMVESNVTVATRSEATAQGELFLWELYLYNPLRYPSVASGKDVAKFELIDTYTTTTYADMDQVYVAIDPSGTYSLDRDHLAANLVIDAPAAGSQPSFEFDPSQRGRWVRVFIAHGDKGAGSQVQWQCRLTYTDGTVQTVAITDFAHQPDVKPAYHASTEMTPLTYDTDSGEWKENGTVVTVDTSLPNLFFTSCGQLPITYTPYLFGSTFTINSPIGGSGSGYVYSIDGGKTTQASPTFNLGSGGAREIIPTVIDGDGTRSAKSGLTSYVPCVNSSWFADISAGTNTRNSHVPGTGSGFEGEFSDLLGQQLEHSNSGLSWNLNLATNNTSYLYIGNGFTADHGSADALLAPVLPVAENGQVYTVAVDAYNYYFGWPFSKNPVTVKIVDTVTSAVLGQWSHIYYGNGVENRLNQTLDFIGLGNPVRVEIDANNSTLTPESGFFGDIWNLNIDSISTDGYTKRGGADWATVIVSDKGKAIGGTPRVEFQATAFPGNCGMHGLNGQGANDSYSQGDYLIYLNGSSATVYINGGASVASGAYTDADVFAVQVNPDGSVLFQKNNSTFHSLPAGTATQPVYWYQGNPYATNLGIKGYTFSGANVDIHSGDWIGQADKWTEDGGKLVKQFNAGWNVWMHSEQMRARANGVVMSFNPLNTDGSGINDGMFGLAANTPSASYTTIDYAFYITGNQIYIYENGTSRGIFANAYTPATDLRIEIDADGAVRYYIGAGAPKRTLPAGSATADYYFAELTPYAIGGGIQNLSFNGDVEFEIADSTGHYLRFDNLRLFEGNYSDGTHYSYKTSNHLLTRNIRGDEVWTFDAHTHSMTDDVMVIPVFDVRPYGTLRPDDYIDMQYRVEGGTWVTMWREYGPFNTTHERDLQEFEYMQGVDLPAGDTIQYRAVIHMEDVDVNRGYYIYGVRDYVKCS